jgi:hypothetical protein
MTDAHSLPYGRRCASGQREDFFRGGWTCRRLSQADTHGFKALLRFIHNEVMPGSCHGSPAKVAAWIAHGEKCRAGETDCIHDTWYESQPVVARGTPTEIDTMDPERA